MQHRGRKKESERPAQLVAASSVFPFSAVESQEELKTCLVLTAIDPLIGGLLAMGDRGTGKSTTVRAFAALLPTIKAIKGCPYNCDPAKPQQQCAECRSQPAPRAQTRAVPVVDLPLGATEDRVVGALNLERALSRGEKVFEPGLLAKANRGYLYIDEVNLLEDHLVDLLLDVAASGENIFEREGLSVRHPARFVLVGSGNPEEGELRPQLLDRFGLSIEVRTPGDVPSWVEIVKRREAFDRDPKSFLTQWEAKDRRLRMHIKKARVALEDVNTSTMMHEKTARLCLTLKTDGLRGQLTLLRAARALAALESSSEVKPAHIRRMAVPALRHRLRRNPLEDTGSAIRIAKALEETMGP